MYKSCVDTGIRIRGVRCLKMKEKSIYLHTKLFSFSSNMQRESCEHIYIEVQWKFLKTKSCKGELLHRT